MANSILYITFKDTVSNNQVDLAAKSIAQQLISAAELIKEDPSKIYLYLRQDAPVFTSKPKKEEKVQEAEELPVISTSDDALDTIFRTLKRTSKSEKILKYLIDNAGTDMTIEQLMVGASINKNDLSSWLAQTGKKIPAITNPSRGVYKFNPDKLNYGKK